MIRDQVYILRNGQSQTEEGQSRFYCSTILLNISLSAMAAILRDKINELLTENANLERELSRLREAEREVQPSVGNTHRDIKTDLEIQACVGTPPDDIKTDLESELKLGPENSPIQVLLRFDSNHVGVLSL